MTIIDYIVTVAGYASGDIVTFHVDADLVFSYLGYQYDHIELCDPSDVVVHSDSSTEFVATSYIYYNIDGQHLWEFSYKLYCIVDGETRRVFLSCDQRIAALYATLSNPVVVFPLQGGGKVAIPLVTPSVGDSAVVLPLQGGGKVSTRLYTPAVGNKVAVMQLQGGGKVVIPLVKEDKYVTLRVRVNFGDGGTHELESTIFDSVEWLEITQFYGIPSEYNPFFFQYIEFYSQYNTKTATVQSVGASKDFGSQYNIEQVLTYYVKFYMGYLYIDKIQFRNYNTSEIYDLNGNGGFETDPTNWNITGDAEISTSEAYEGTHSLKLF